MCFPHAQLTCMLKVFFFIWGKAFSYGNIDETDHMCFVNIFPSIQGASSHYSLDFTCHSIPFFFYLLHINPQMLELFTYSLCCDEIHTTKVIISNIFRCLVNVASSTFTLCSHNHHISLKYAYLPLKVSKTLSLLNSNSTFLPPQTPWRFSKAYIHRNRNPKILYPFS